MLFCAVSTVGARSRARLRLPATVSVLSVEHVGRQLHGQRAQFEQQVAFFHLCVLLRSRNRLGPLLACPVAAVRAWCVRVCLQCALPGRFRVDL